MKFNAEQAQNGDGPYVEVIGYPIKHSKSPLIHGFWLEQLGINAQYRAIEVAPEDLGAYFTTRRADPHWLGCNITLPHKVNSMDHVDEVGEVKLAIGAVNTVFRDAENPQILRGTNTDAAGFFSPIADIDWQGKSAIIIGSGGAARAILFALSRAQIGKVTMVARSALKAMGLLASFGLKGGVINFGDKLPPADLIVNCSPLGQQGQDDMPESIFDSLAIVKNSPIIYDLVYNPIDTKFLNVAESLELDNIDGLSMLIGQAALAFNLFFGQSPPEGVDEQLRRILLDNL
ncbi:shikimate dehydrogenase [Sphingorhabdus lutea]|uniref:Shikimate dehydrogenase (NADP(+)) n=1 Tax=Sphingorhabdus lutea TaxID=1913578 RepID=A0A1L3J9I7_9SPHN|nr:shikimate dehydrogenase [Sphingorhabdus lutea]APG61753.1 shikimate dehydrogenase [Sphingorhabdus lutea]